ncbi:MAG: winged helix-turn-helix transcriptional regulator [Chitinophagaceae bacterium]
MSITSKERDKIAAVFTGTCSQKKVCPVKDIMATYGDKWSMYTILLLGQHKKMRFNEMRSAITGISQRMLAVTLRSLEHDGMISRTLFPEIPPRVEYCLTELGDSLLKQILEFATWADANFDAIMNARKKYENKKQH